VRYLLLILLTVIPGIAGIIVFGYFALIDWNALQQAYQRFAETIRDSSDLQVVLIAEAQQNIHRLNLFAEGVWALLSAILAAIGLHGTCTIPQRRRARK